MREVMYSPRSGIQQPYTSSRRSPPRGGEVLDSRSNMQFPPSGGNHPQTSYNDYRTYSTPAPYGAPPPDMRPPSYPTHTHTQQYDARDLQYGAYWSTSKWGKINLFLSLGSWVPFIKNLFLLDCWVPFTLKCEKLKWDCIKIPQTLHKDIIFIIYFLCYFLKDMCVLLLHFRERLWTNESGEKARTIRVQKRACRVTIGSRKTDWLFDCRA